MLQVKEIEKKILTTAVNEASTTYVVPTLTRPHGISGSEIMA